MLRFEDDTLERAGLQSRDKHTMPFLVRMASMLDLLASCCAAWALPEAARLLISMLASCAHCPGHC